MLKQINIFFSDEKRQFILKVFAEIHKYCLTLFVIIGILTNGLTPPQVTKK